VICQGKVFSSRNIATLILKITSQNLLDCGSLESEIVFDLDEAKGVETRKLGFYRWRPEGRALIASLNFIASAHAAARTVTTTSETACIGAVFVPTFDEWAPGDMVSFARTELT